MPSPSKCSQRELRLVFTSQSTSKYTIYIIQYNICLLIKYEYVRCECIAFAGIYLNILTKWTFEFEICIYLLSIYTHKDSTIPAEGKLIMKSTRDRCGNLLGWHILINFTCHSAIFVSRYVSFYYTIYFSIIFL